MSRCGNLLVHPKLEALGIDHDQAHVVGRGAVEDAGQHRVQPDRLAGAGRAGDEQVRHRRQVGHERFAVDRLAERDGQLRRRVLVGLRFEQLAQRDRLAVRVGNLDPDRGLAGDAIDQHGFGLHRQAQVVGQPGDLAVLHAGIGLELEGRHHRAGVDLHHRALDRELAALLLEVPGRVHQFALVHLALGLGRIEQRRRRQHVGALAAFGWRPADRLDLGERKRRGDGNRPLALSAADHRRRRGPDIGRCCGLGVRSRRLARRGRRRLHHGARRDLGRGLVAPPVLGQHLAAQLLPAALVEPGAGLAAPHLGAAGGRVQAQGEHAAQRHLRGQHQRQGEERDDDDDRSRAVQVGGEPRGGQRAEEAAGLERPRSRGRRPDHQAEHRAGAGEDQPDAGHLGIERVHRPAPEVPASPPSRPAPAAGRRRSRRPGTTARRGTRRPCR